MNWKTHFFGVPNPSRSRYIAIAAVPLGAGMIFHAIYTNFVPSSIFMGRGAMLVFLMLGVVLTGFWFRWSRSSGNWARLGGRGWLVLLFAPLIMAGAMWLIVAKSAACMLTIVFGQPHAVETTMKAEYRYSRRACDYQLTGGALEHGFPGYLCIKESFYKKHRNKKVKVRLVGQRTILGFRIAKIFEVRKDVSATGGAKSR